MTNSRKFIISLLAIVCIILSSCAVKASIRNFLSEDQQTVRFNTNKKHTQLHQAGISCISSDTVNENADQPVSHTVAVAALVATIVTGIISLVQTIQSRATLLLKNTVSLQGLPIFLQHRRLII